MSEKLEQFGTLPAEIINEHDRFTVTVSKDVLPEEKTLFWNMVRDGFTELNRKSYEKQDMTQEELYADLDAEDVLKYIARDANNQPIGLLTVHVGFEGINWTNTTRLEEAQAEKDSDAVPYYVGTLVVPPDMRGSQTAGKLIKGALLHFSDTNLVNDRQSLVFFDCADANYPGLGHFIQKVGSPSKDYPLLNTTVEKLYSDAWVLDHDVVSKIRETEVPLTSVVLDIQHYYSITLDPSNSK